MIEGNLGCSIFAATQSNKPGLPKLLSNLEIQVPPEGDYKFLR